MKILKNAANASNFKIVSTNRGLVLRDVGGGGGGGSVSTG